MQYSIDMPTTQLVLRLPVEEKAHLEALAHTQGTTISELARTALKDFIKQHFTYNYNSLSKLGNLGKAYTLKDAPRDLSVNYKHYLYGTPKKKV